MEFQHELIIPNEGFPFKVFLFEGGNGNYVREKHWHTSVEIGPSLVARHSTRPVRHKSWQNTSRIYNVLSNLR